MTALAVNGSYRFTNKLLFTGQLFYKYYEYSPITDALDGGLGIDFAILKLLLSQYDYHTHELEIGQLKIPYGLYNESRTSPFTTPSLFLSQAVYPNKMLMFTTAASGAMYEYTYNNLFDRFSLNIQLGLGYPQISDEVKAEFFPLYGASNKLKSELSRMATISLDTFDFKYRFKISYVDTYVSSTNFDTDLNFQSAVISLQYNTLKSRTTIEINPEKAVVRNGISSGTSLGWYIQHEYYFHEKLTGLVRYESLDVKPELSFLKSTNYHAWAFNMVYRVNNNLRFEGYYQKSWGKNPLIKVSAETGMPLNPSEKWDVFGLSINYLF